MSNNKTEDIEVELKITGYKFPPEVIQNGLHVTDNIPVIFTITNTGFDDFKCGDLLMIRKEEDKFFQTSAVRMEGLQVEAFGGSTEFSFTMIVKNLVKNLYDLPKEIEVKIINKKRDVVAGITVTIPIELYVLGLKKRFRSKEDPVNVLLFGQVGMGKSSFINTTATVFNEHIDFKHKVISVATSGSTTGTLTKSLKSFQFGNMRIFDTWGWEKTEENANMSYNEQFFKCLLQGLVPENFDLDNVKNFDFNDVDEKAAKKNKIDVVIFLVTPQDCSEDYLTLARKFQGICGSLDVKTMFLLTQIDFYDEALEKDPYINAGQNLNELLEKISTDYALVKVNIKPIVNYVNNEERTWELDKACFIPISHCIMLAVSGQDVE